MDGVRAARACASGRESPRLGLVGASPTLRLTLEPRRHSSQLVEALAAAGLACVHTEDGVLTRPHGTRTELIGA